MEIFVKEFTFVDFLPQTEKGSFDLFKGLHENKLPRKSLKELKRMYIEEKDNVARAFVKAGWEGDGTIMCIWIPPFINYGLGETCGSYIWHVKQSNNGISFLGFINHKPNKAFRFIAD